MSELRRLQATFTAVTAVRSNGSGGVALGFRPERTRLGVDHIEDFAELGAILATDAAAADSGAISPAGGPLTVSSVAGIGKVLRLLRAARVAPPRPPYALIGRENEAASLLERAIGTRVVLSVRARSRVRFLAWTDAGLETVTDVADVLQDENAWLVLRRDGRFPVRVPRTSVVRQRTECETWYEVLDIGRG